MLVEIRDGYFSKPTIGTERHERMESIKILEHARALYTAHGDKAEAEAAQKATKCEEAGNTAEAADWRKIRKAISQMRGPHES